MILKAEINNNEYRNYSDVTIEEWLYFPFRIQMTLVPNQEKPLTEIFLNKPAIIRYDPLEGDRERFTWMEPATAYYGYVLEERRYYATNQEVQQVTLDIRHPLQMLDNGARFRVFHERPLMAIFDAIFVPYQSVWKHCKINKVEYSPDLYNLKLPYCTQYQESDLHFCLRLCETYGVRLLLYDQVIRLFSMAHQPLELSPPCKTDAAAVQWERVSTSLARQLRHRNLPCTEFPDQLTTNTVTVKTNTADEIMLPPYDLDLFEPDITAAKGKMEVRKASLQHQEILWIINSRQKLNNRPVAGIRVGHMVNLRIPGKAAGQEEEIAIHQLKVHVIGTASPGNTSQKADYQITLYGREKKFPYAMPLQHTKPQVNSFLRARIIEPDKPSNGDDKKLGRVKVQFFWQEQPDSTCWVRVMMPYAGKSHGFYVMPEVGDEVLIGFDGGDIDNPYCLGSVYNQDAQNLRTMNQAQQMETIRLQTPENIHLDFHEIPKGEQTIMMGIKDMVSLIFCNKTPSGSLQSQGTAYLTSHSLMQILSKDAAVVLLCKAEDRSLIRLDKDGKIVIAAKDQIQEQADTITLQAEQISEKATKKFVLEAGTKLELKGPGGYIVIDAAGVTINGRIVKIN